MAADEMTPDESFDEDFDAVDDPVSDADSDPDTDAADEDLPADHGGPTRDQRLRMLLFMLQEKLRQRSRLGRKALGMLILVLGLCVAAAAFAPLVITLVVSREPIGPAADYCVQVLYVALALTPFVLSIANYFWTTYAQIFFRGLTNVERLLDSEP